MIYLVLIYPSLRVFNFCPSPHVLTVLGKLLREENRICESCPLLLQPQSCSGLFPSLLTSLCACRLLLPALSQLAQPLWLLCTALQDGERKFCLRFVLAVGLEVSSLLWGEWGQGDGAERGRSWRLQVGWFSSGLAWDLRGWSCGDLQPALGRSGGERTSREWQKMNPSSQHSSLGATRVWTADLLLHELGQGSFCHRLKKFPLLSPECGLGLLTADRHTS